MSAAAAGEGVPPEAQSQGLGAGMSRTEPEGVCPRRRRRSSIEATSNDARGPLARGPSPPILSPMPVDVASEIGSLESVLVHTPGHELEAVTPGNREDYLYDDIIDLEIAQRE